MRALASESGFGIYIIAMQDLPPCVLRQINGGQLRVNESPRLQGLTPAFVVMLFSPAF